MPKDSLKAIADERGIEVIDLIIETVNRVGSIQRAAKELGVWHTALRWHIKRHNLMTIRADRRSKLMKRVNGKS